MRRCALFVVAVLVGTAGCDDGDEGAASTTTEAPTTTEAEATTTSAPAPDPFSVPADPADIDEAYVEAVLAELERINGDALRLAVTEGLSPRITELIQSIYEPSRAAVELQGFALDAGEQFPNVRRPPGNVTAVVDELLVANASCISVDATLDFAEVAESPVEVLSVRIELRPKASGIADNPTPWVYSMRDGVSAQTSVPDPCVET